MQEITVTRVTECELGTLEDIAFGGQQACSVFDPFEGDPQLSATWLDPEKFGAMVSEVALDVARRRACGATLSLPEAALIHYAAWVALEHGRRVALDGELVALQGGDGDIPAPGATPDPDAVLGELETLTDRLSVVVAQYSHLAAQLRRQGG